MPQGTELRRAALELKVAQARDALQAAGADVASAVATALEILTRNASGDQAEYERQHSIPQKKPVYLFSASQRLVRALEGIAGTLDTSESFSIEIRDASGSVTHVEMSEGAFKATEVIAA